MPPSDDAVALADLSAPSDRISALSAAEIDAFVSATSDAVLVLDPEGRCVRVGPCAPDPRNAPLQALLGRRVDDVFPPEVAHACRVAIAQALSTRRPQRVAYTFPVGRELHQVAATLAPTAEGTVVWIARDLTPRFEAAADAARRERELSDVFEAAFDGMLVCASDLRCLAVNSALSTMLGRPRDELLGSDYPALIAPDDLTERPLRMPELRASRRLVTERRLVRADGSEVDTEVGTTLLEDGRVLFVIRDISARKVAEAAIQSLALRDELTGLFNRRGFQQAAEREWARAAREGWDVLLFALDLDDLKPINDAHGHAAGDAALIAVAQALGATFRHADVVARVGGDEFAALIVPAGLSAGSGDGAPDRLRATADVIRGRLDHHLTAANLAGAATGRPPLGVSLGLAHTRPVVDSMVGAGIAALVAEADAALYVDKAERKRGRYKG